MFSTAYFIYQLFFGKSNCEALSLSFNSLSPLESIPSLKVDVPSFNIPNQSLSFMTPPSINAPSVVPP
eukprot:Pgem_evm3s16705